MSGLLGIALCATAGAFWMAPWWMFGPPYGREDWWPIAALTWAGVLLFGLGVDALRRGGR